MSHNARKHANGGKQPNKKKSKGYYEKQFAKTRRNKMKRILEHNGKTALSKWQEINRLERR